MTDFSMYFKTFGMELLAEPRVYFIFFLIFKNLFIIFFGTKVPIDDRKEVVHHLKSFAPGAAQADRALG